jgi:hypothetical protein
MAATVDTAQVPTTRRIGLRREIGFIGLLWASGGSIIGSGRLFGAQGALATAGPAAIISWTIGAVAILLLALVHAELRRHVPRRWRHGALPALRLRRRRRRLVRLVLVAAGGDRAADRGHGDESSTASTTRSPAAG